MVLLLQYLCLGFSVATGDDFLTEFDDCFVELCGFSGLDLSGLLDFFTRLVEFFVGLGDFFTGLGDFFVGLGDFFEGLGDFFLGLGDFVMGLVELFVFAGDPFVGLCDCEEWDSVSGSPISITSDCNIKCRYIYSTYNIYRFCFTYSFTEMVNK